MRFLLLFLALLSASAQALNDQQFQISYGAAGITGLQHAGDSYPTEYVAPGRALGDLTVRYRSAGETAWKQIGAAGANSSSAP
jgi:hypothetical protein